VIRHRALGKAVSVLVAVAILSARLPSGAGENNDALEEGQPSSPGLESRSPGQQIEDAPAGHIRTGGIRVVPPALSDAEVGGPWGDADLARPDLQASYPELELAPGMVGDASARDEDYRPEPPPIYDWWVSFGDWGAWVADSCASGLTVPGLWSWPFSCLNIEQICPYCWVAFAAWYYLDNPPLPAPCCWPEPVPIEKAPLYMPPFEAHWRDGHQLPLPTCAARFTPIRGVSCLKTIPLDCTKTGRPVVAAARYKIAVHGQPSSDPNCYSGALFFLTALYDETLFDVTVEGNVYRQGSTEYAYRRDALSNARPLMFQARVYRVYIDPNELTYRQTEWRPEPDFVIIKLREGRSLDELRSRSVRLMLHTLNWVGDKCDNNLALRGDHLSFHLTDVVDVGACPDALPEDWWIEPPPLKDECPVPLLAGGESESDGLEVASLSAIRNGSMRLPSMRVGHNRFWVGRTMGETLGNLAVAYGPAWCLTEDGRWSPRNPVSFILVDLFGVRFAIEDVPWWSWDPNAVADCSAGPLNVYDHCANMRYRYTRAWSGGVLVWLLSEIYDPASAADPQRTYVYEIVNNKVRLAQQVERGDPNASVRRLSYEYEPHQTPSSDENWQLRVTGTASDGGGERTLVMLFGPWARGEYDWAGRSRPLLQLQVASNAVRRDYEWYSEDPNVPVGCAGKLKKIVEADGGIAAQFTYDNKGRLTTITRRSATSLEAQQLAEFLYCDMDDPNDPDTMIARFWVDSSHYQMAVRIFDKYNRVVKIEEYEQLGQPAGGSWDGWSPNLPTLEGAVWRPLGGLPYKPNLPEHPPGSGGGQPEESWPPPYPLGDGWPPTTDSAVPVPGHSTIPPPPHPTPPEPDRVAVTLFDYHTPPPGADPNAAESYFWQSCDFGAGAPVLVSRCVEKTWPNGQMSEYTFFDCRFLPAESYVGPPGQVAPSEKLNHIMREWSRGPNDAWGVSQVIWEQDVSRGALVELEYDSDGYLSQRLEPIVSQGVNTGMRAFRGVFYDSRHRIDYEYRSDPNVPSGGILSLDDVIVIDYEYDDYGHMTCRREYPFGDPDQAREWHFVYNAFGDEIRRIDPDGYVTCQEWDSAGFLVRKYTYASGAAGQVLEETQYTYTDGRLVEVRVADHEGPFTLGEPSAWIISAYGYDGFGRVVSKTISRTGSVEQFVTRYEYDLQDRLTRIVYPDGRWKMIVRNGRGQIVQTWIGPDPILMSRYEYDLNGNLVRRICEGCPDCARETRYEYDAYNRRTAEIRVGQ